MHAQKGPLLQKIPSALKYFQCKNYIKNVIFKNLFFTTVHYIPVFLILLKWKQRKDTKKWLLKRLQRVDNCTENSSIYIVNKLDIVCTQ